MRVKLTSFLQAVGVCSLLMTVGCGDSVDASGDEEVDATVVAVTVLVTSDTPAQETEREVPSSDTSVVTVAPTTTTSVVTVAPTTTTSVVTVAPTTTTSVVTVAPTMDTYEPTDEIFFTYEPET